MGHVIIYQRSLVTLLFCRSLHVQVLGTRSPDSAKQQTGVKDGHNAYTASGNARGHMLPPFMVFKGKRDLTRLVADAPGAAYCLTENGWPSADTWYCFCKFFLDHIKAMGLTKALLIVDGHDDHFSLPALQLLRDNRVTLLSLPPACTHKMQPLDALFFGLLKRLIAKFIKQRGKRATKQCWAHLIHLAHLHMSLAAQTSGKLHTLAAGFRDCGLVPWNPSIFTDADFAMSDAALSLSADAERVRKAREVTLEKVGISLDRILGEATPVVKAKLDERVRSSGFDLAQIAATDDAFVQKLLTKESQKEAEAKEKAERAEVRAGKAEERKAADAAKAAARAAKASAAAAKAAPRPKAPKPAAKSKAKAPARVQAEQGALLAVAGAKRKRREAAAEAESAPAGRKQPRAGPSRAL